MNGSRSPLLVFAILAGLLVATSGRGQIPTRPVTELPATGDAIRADATRADTAPGLPHPPDLPTSLYAPPAMLMPPAEMPPRRRQYDPLIDVPGLPQPGWFAELEGTVIGPRVGNQLVNTVTIANRPADIVRLKSAPLDWTFSPKLEIGRRLSGGFGEISLSYRFMGTSGNGTTFGPDGPLALHSHFDLDVIDLDYGSREISLWPLFEMKWRIGLRGAVMYFDSRAIEPVGVAAAGSGIFRSRVSDTYGGVGPHVSVDIWRHLGSSAWSVYGRFEGGTLAGEIRQGFSEVSTTPMGNGFLAGSTHVHDGQAVPMIIPQLGLHWKPIQTPRYDFFVGYQYEHWWNVGRLSATPSRGEFYSNGFFLRASHTF